MNPYIGEIRMFGGNFAPVGWAFCDGSLLPISENETLFNLIGTTYGGDGQSTFGVPDLRGRVPIHMGNSQIGQNGGTEDVTLTTQQIPGHNHTFQGSTNIADQVSGAGQVVGQSSVAQLFRAAGAAADFAASAVASTGGSQPHSNLQPFLCINYIIATAGIYPTQS
jgi:microcystin-dependent protein